MELGTFLEVLLKGIVAAGAAYRLTMLLLYDDGPSFGLDFEGKPEGIITRLRRKLGVDDRGPDGSPRGDMGRLFGCPWCLGVWTAALCLMLTFLPYPWWLLVLGWGALAAVAGYGAARS